MLAFEHRGDQEDDEIEHYGGEEEAEESTLIEGATMIEESTLLDENTPMQM